MQKKVLWSVILLIVLVTPLVWAGTEDEANKLFTDACQWAAMAQKTEASSYAKAVELNRKALTAVERVLKEYGKSALATKLLKGEVKIGGYTYADFSERVTRSQKNQVWAEGNIFGAALLMAKPVANAQEQRELLTQVLEEYWNYTKKPSEEILSVAFETAQAFREPRKKLQAMLQIAEYTRAGSPERAAILREVEREVYTEADSLVMLADLYALVGRTDPMLDRLQQAAKRTKDPMLTRQIARGLGAVKHYDEAVVLAKKYGTTADKQDALLGVIAQAAENGDYSKAVALIDTLSTTQAKQSGWIYIAVGYAKNADLAGALLQLKHLQRSEEQMEMLHEVGYYYKSEVTTEVLRQVDSLPDVMMKIQVLLAFFENYYFRRDLPHGAMMVLNRCLTILQESRAYEENPGLAGALAQNFGLLRQTDAMAECYALFLKAVEDERQIEDVEELLENGSHYLPMEIFVKLLDQTVKYTNEKLSGSIAGYMLNLAGTHYRAIGQAARGLQVVKAGLERISGSGMEEVMVRLSVTAGRCALDAGDAKKAAEMALQADTLVRKIPRYSGMRDLFELHCDLGDVEKVKERIAKEKEYVDFYVTWVDDLIRTAEGCLRWGRWEQAIKVLEEMLAQRPDKANLERNEILGGLAVFYGQRRDYARVKQMFEGMQNEDIQSLTLARLASIGIYGKDETLLKTSIEWAQKLSIIGCSRTLQEIVIPCAEVGRFEQAFTLVETIRDPLGKSQALLRLATVYAKKGKACDEVTKKHLRKILSGN